MAVVHLRIVACAGAPVRRCGGAVVRTCAGAQVFEWVVPGPRVGRRAACKYEVMGSGLGIRGLGSAVCGCPAPGARCEGPCVVGQVGTFHVKRDRRTCLSSATWHSKEF